MAVDAGGGGRGPRAPEPPDLEKWMKTPGLQEGWGDEVGPARPEPSPLPLWQPPAMQGPPAPKPGQMGWTPKFPSLAGMPDGGLPEPGGMPTMGVPGADWVEHYEGIVNPTPDAPPGPTEITRMRLYDLVDMPAMVYETLMGRPATSWKSGGRSYVDTLLADPNREPWQVAGALIYGAVWAWGAEFMYQLPKIPERIFWTNKESGAWVHMNWAPCSGDLPMTPYSHAWMQDVAGLSTPGTDVVLQTHERYVETTPDQLLQYLKEGEIGYTFSVHPDRLQPFRDSIDAGVSVDESIREYEDFWLELGLNTLIDPAWLIPASWMKFIWPGGALVGAAVGKVGGAVARSAAMKRGTQEVMGDPTTLMRAKDWLVAFTKRSQVARAGQQATDAIAEIVLRRPDGTDPLIAASAALSDDFTDLGNLGPTTRRSLQDLNEAMAEKGIAGFDALVLPHMPKEFVEAWADDLIQPHLRKNPMLISWLVGQAVEKETALTIGYVPPGARNGISRAYAFARGILKEQWLSLNPAYMLGNSVDNTSKCWATGHYINPLDLGAPGKVASYMADYGTATPSQVVESLVASEIGEDISSQTRRIAIPGLGKPAEIVDWWSKTLRMDLRTVAPWLDSVAPRRSSQVLLAMNLAEPPSRTARFLDNINYASLSEAGRTMSSKIEQSARTQIFWDVFSREMEENARPALLKAAKGLSLSDDMLAILGSPGLTRSPADISDLLRLVGDDAPLARFSAMVPEGADPASMGQIARALDDLQTDAIARGDLEGLARDVDELFDALLEQARRTAEAGTVEEVITKWKAYQVREGVKATLGRGREVSDFLLQQVRERVAEDPRLAGSLWPRYVDNKAQISDGIWQDVSRMVKTRSPEMSDKADALLGRMAGPEDIAKGLSYDDWGTFGERLAGLRDGVDEAQEMSWKAFMDGEMTEARLHQLEVAYDKVTGVWQETAGEAAAWRRGYIEGKGVSAERYETIMDEIWEGGFKQAREAWGTAEGRLVTEEAFTKVTKAAEWINPEFSTSVDDVVSGMYLPGEGRLGFSADEAVEHGHIFKSLTGEVDCAKSRAAARPVTVMRCPITGKVEVLPHWKKGAPSDRLLEDTQGALKALLDSGISPDTTVKTYKSGWAGDSIQGTLREVMDEVDGLIGKAGPGKVSWWTLSGPDDDIVEATAQSLTDMQGGVYIPGEDRLALSTHYEVTHAGILDFLRGEDVEVAQPTSFLWGSDREGAPILEVLPHWEGGVPTRKILEDARGALKALGEAGLPPDTVVRTYKSDRAGDSLMGTLREVTEQIDTILKPLDSADALRAYRQKRALDPEMVATFREMQKTDPVAARDWFLAQREQAQMRLQQDAQGEFVEDLGTQYAERMGEAGTNMRRWLEEWRLAIGSQIQDGIKTRTTQEAERVVIKGDLDTLAQKWANSIDGAKVSGSLETGRVLYDYSHTQNWEGMLSHLFPFTKWQLRNPFTWVQILSQNPAAFSLLTRYVRASDEWRERENLSERFKWTMPLPGQDQLQDAGLIEEGMHAVDPSPAFSIAGQLGTPFVTPEEEEMRETAEPWRRWLGEVMRAPEHAGIHTWPWIQQAGAIAGAVRSPSYGATGAAGRVFPGVRRAEDAIPAAVTAAAQMAGQIIGGEEPDISGLMQDTDWLADYWTEQTLAAWVSEGKITAWEAADPTPELRAEAEQVSAASSQGRSFARWMQPFALKFAREGEMDIRNLKAELSEMPEERAAFMRSQHPEIAAYGRAVTSVSDPEGAQWRAQRDEINLRYDEMSEGLPPWHPRNKEIQDLRRAELDALPEQPEGEEWQGPEDIMRTLEQDRPRPQDFEGEEGINWDEYNKALDDYSPTVEAAGISVQEYEKYRRRYLSPLELAWEFQQEHLAEGWDEYGRLKDLHTRKPVLPQFGKDRGPDLTSAPPEIRAWVGSEIQRRLQEGWAPEDVLSWAGEQDRLPYDEIQRLLAEEYGPQTVGEYMPQVMEERPWLEEGRPEELAGINEWIDMEMPGFGAWEGKQTEAQQFESEVRDWYYDLLPQQARLAREELGIEEGMAFSDWEGMTDLPPEQAERLFATLAPVSEGVRLQAELDLVRYDKGTGEWTDLLTMYYTDPNAPKSMFWTEQMKLPLSDEAHDDPQLQMFLDADLRGRMAYSDEQWQVAYDYLMQNKDRLVDQEAMALAEASPEWFELAQEERAEAKGAEMPKEISDEYWALTTKDERNEWKEANPEMWKELSQAWNKGNERKIMNPHYLYIYKHDKYEQWFGDTPPDTLKPKKELGAFREAQAEMDAYADEGGEWTEGMDRWFGSDTPSKRFWNYYHENKPFTRVGNDPLIGFLFSKEERDAMPFEMVDWMYEQALGRLQDWTPPPMEEWELRKWQREQEKEEPAPAPPPSAPAPPPSGGGGGGGGGGGPPPPPPPPAWLGQADSSRWTT